MAGTALEVGAFTWARINRLYDADPAVHWEKCQAKGLECPLAVFSQLFRRDTNNKDFTALISSVDWGRVRWDLQEFSGVVLRQVRIDRSFQHAFDESRSDAARLSICTPTWAVPPVLVNGSVLGTSLGYELLVGSTRVGFLLGLMDRQKLLESTVHLVWLGSDGR